MSKYLFQVNYVGEGVKGLIKEGGSSRRAATEKMVQSMGGKIEAYYFCFGEYDNYVIVDFPDNVTAAAVALTVCASGAVVTKTVVLLTPEEVDNAVKKSPIYRAPGQ